jgi:hypothetical protein
VWLYEPKTTLTPVQRAVVECGLEGALADVLSEYRGGLLAPNEARAVLGLVRICDATQPPPADLAARPNALTALLAPLMTLAVNCFCCFDCCCDCCCGCSCCFSCSWCCNSGWCCNNCWDCCWGCSTGWNCCWPGCYWGGYPCWPYYYGMYNVTPGVVSFAYPGAYCYAAPVISTSGNGSGSSGRSGEVEGQASARQDDAVVRNFSVVRRRLLMKYNKEPGDALGLYARAVRAYGYRDYQEADDLAWAALQLQDQDARFWYVKALAERGLGEHEAALASARQGAARALLAGEGNDLRGLGQLAEQDRRFLVQVSAELTLEQARVLVAGPAVALNR